MWSMLHLRGGGGSTCSSWRLTFCHRMRMIVARFLCLRMLALLRELSRSRRTIVIDGSGCSRAFDVLKKAQSVYG